MTISAGSATDVSEVIIKNLGNYNIDGKGTVDGTKITFNVTGSVSVTGFGTLTGNKLEYTYTATQGSASETCTGTATKQ